MLMICCLGYCFFNSLYFFTNSQLTYVQYIDKYFPNMSLEETKLKFINFKAIIFLLLWLSFLFLLDGLGYFDKF